MSTSTSFTASLDMNDKSAEADKVDSLPVESVDTTEKDVERIATSKSTRRDVKQGLAKTVTAQDWTATDDPENPQNWPFWQRVYHTTVPALFGLAVTFGSSVYTPAVHDVMKQFNVSSTVALLGLSLYVLGLGFGPILAAPISETKGRRVVYLISLPLSALFTLGAGFSNNFASLGICRFFAGFFGGPSLAVGAGTSVDIWPPVYRAVATGSFILAPFLGPALGPAVGGFTAQYKGWRWTQWTILFMMVPIYLYSLGSKETYKKLILQKRAKRLGIAPPVKVGPTGLAAVGFLITVTLFRPVYMIFNEPIVFFFSIYTGFAFSVLFGFFAAFPIVFQGVYHFQIGFSGLTFLAIGLGVIFGVTTVIVVDRLWYRKEYVKSHAEGRLGVVAPEHRLYVAMMGSFGLPLGLFWFAWTSRADIHWISPVLATIPFAWSNVAIFGSAALYLSDVYGPLNGASALAANGLVRYGLGAVFPLFTIQMYERLGIAWATSLLGFISLLMLPIPWVLFKYGRQIRAKSHFYTIKL